MDTQRIKFLDGFRGIAILLVILYHAYSRYPEVVPYLTNNFGEFPLFKFGFWGVQLFFLISGFVILMSLENKRSFLYFIYRRWLRLFPAMLIATILICITAGFLHERPLGQPTLTSILPGLLFIEPEWLGFVFNIDITPLETVFWTLYVEFKFYIIFGALFFLLGRIRAVSTITIIFFSAIFVQIMSGLSADLFKIDWLTSIFNGLALISNQLSLLAFGWFAMGAWAYLYYKDKKIKYLWFAISTVVVVTIIAMIVPVFGDRLELLIGPALVTMFLIPVCIRKSRWIFSNKFLYFIGFVSYPLYLIHSNAMISLTVKLHDQFQGIPPLLLPILPIATVVFTAFIIARYLEPKLKHLIDSLIKKFIVSRNKSTMDIKTNH